LILNGDQTVTLRPGQTSIQGGITGTLTNGHVTVQGGRTIAMPSEATQVFIDEYTIVLAGAEETTQPASSQPRATISLPTSTTRNVQSGNVPEATSQKGEGSGSELGVCEILAAIFVWYLGQEVV
jgi:hypothetical protein